MLNLEQIQAVENVKNGDVTLPLVLLPVEVRDWMVKELRDMYSKYSDLNTSHNELKNFTETAVEARNRAELQVKRLEKMIRDANEVLTLVE